MCPCFKLSHVCGRIQRVKSKKTGTSSSSLFILTCALYNWTLPNYQEHMLVHGIRLKSLRDGAHRALKLAPFPSINMVAMVKRNLQASMCSKR